MPSTTNGLIWSAIERFSVQGISFILSIVIARLITPGDYGLIAMLNIFMAIAQVFIDSGFGSALIQKKNRNETDFSTVFFFNLVISVILYFLLYLCAPLIADFYHQPQLTLITRWVGINLIIQSLSLVQRTRLSITLDFKKQAKVSLCAVIASGVLGISLAYCGWGVWAIVYQTLCNNLLASLLLWIVARWRPIITFSVSSFKQLFSFGSKLLASGLLHTIYLNLYSLVIGRFYNASDVGYYNRAYTISQYPSVNIVMVIVRAIFPVQCAHQDEDDWLANNFVKYLRMTCFIVFPLMLLLAVLAKPLVLLVLTEKWAPAADLITILSVAYMWYPIMVINNQILNVKGRSDLFLRAEIIKKVVAIIILFTTLPFGIIWLCIGVLIYNIFDTCLIIGFAKKVICTGYISQFYSIISILTVSCISAVGSLFTYRIFSNEWVQLSIGLLSFYIIFIIGCIVGKINELKLINQILHNKWIH